MRTQLKQFRNYLTQAIDLRRRSRSATSWSQLWDWYGQWSRSLHEGITPLSSRVPWITYGAIEQLGAALPPGARVFEYGSGGSTLFFAGRAGSVTSIEHDADWAHAVNDALSKNGCSNAQVRWVPPRPLMEGVPPDPSDPMAYGTLDDALRNCIFEDYVKSIDAEPDASLDLILIDGRARPSCLHHAMSKVSMGGMIILDNSDRAYYRAAMDNADKRFRRVDYEGPAPCLGMFSRTSIWRTAPSI